MEDVLDVYHRPHNPRRPVVGLDEKPVQLVADVRQPLPPAPGVPRRRDHEYKRNGAANVFAAFEPLGNWRRLAVTERRTRVDWAHFVRDLVDAPRYRDAEVIVLVQDQLNTHTGELVRGVRACRGQTHRGEVGDSLHPQARVVAKRRGDRAERARQTAEAASRAQGETGRGVRCLRTRPQPRPRWRQLALYNRRRADQAKAALPDNGTVVIH